MKKTAKAEVPEDLSTVRGGHTNQDSLNDSHIGQDHTGQEGDRPGTGRDSDPVGFIVHNG